MVSWLAVMVTVLNVVSSVTEKKTVPMVPMKTLVVSTYKSTNKNNVKCHSTHMHKRTPEKLLVYTKEKSA